MMASAGQRPGAGHTGLALFRIDIVGDDIGKELVDLFVGKNLFYVVFFMAFKPCCQLLPHRYFKVGDEFLHFGEFGIEGILIHSLSLAERSQSLLSS